MKKYIICVVVVTSLFGVGVSAAGLNDNVIQGAGLSSCEEWTKDRAKPGGEYFNQLNWVLGFFSSYNYYYPNRPDDVFGSQDYQGVATYLDGWCKHNPKKRPFDGAVRRINASISMDKIVRDGEEIQRIINLR